MCIVFRDYKAAYIFKKTIAIAPFSSTAGLWMAIFALAKGYTIIVMGSRFDFNIYLKALHDHQVLI